MTDLKMLTKEPLTIPNVEKILKARKKEDRNEVQSKVLDYSKKVSKLSEADSNKLVGDLEGLQIPGLTKEEIVSITNISPVTLTELRAVLSGKANLSSENFKRIQEVLVKYAKEK